MKDVVVINGSAFDTLIAVSEEEQTKGLMWKKWPPPVMCFPYQVPAVRKFWMKNTISPLDILFCSDNHIVGIYKGQPLSTMPVGPDRPIDLVIELPAGSSDSHGFRCGDKVQLKCSLATLARQIIQ